MLLLNTCGAEGSVALSDTELDEPIVALERMPGRMASERLVAVVREAMAGAGWKLRELAAIGVVTGPGSFTGVRVGLSVAKGLSEASGVGLIAVSRLEMLAAAAGRSGGRVCALLDAGRGEFYCGDSRGAEGFAEALMSRDEALMVAKSADVVVACEELVAKALSDAISVLMVSEPTAADALPLVLKLLQEGRLDDPGTLDANYLRRTDAEIFAKPAAQKVG